MNSQTGKLLVLGGCGINAVTILLNLLLYVAPIKFLITLISLASIAGLASIVAGFLILFLCDKSILDLVIAGGFGISLITSALAFAINMNLLPIPALDGGRIVFHLIDAIAGRKVIKKEIEDTITGVTLMLLLGFMLLISFKDVINLF